MTGSPRRSVRLPAAAVTLLFAAAALPSLSSAAGPHRPEITDPCGDVDPAATLRPSDLNRTAFDEPLAYDLQDVYILLETATDFLLVFHVCGLPDAWEANETVASKIPTGPNASQPSVRLVANFTVRGASYEVHALLAHPSEGVLRDDYRLWRGQANQSLQGAVDAAKDTVTVRIAKGLVGQPGLGDFLTRFRAEGWFREARLDFAPDAAPVTPEIDAAKPTLVLERLHGQAFYEPRYGSNYAFGSYPQAQSRLRLESADLGRVVPSGQSTDYTLVVVNGAPVADQVSLTLSHAPDGFAHRLSATTVALQPGEQRQVTFTASAHAQARGDLYSLITASSTLGESAAHAFITRFYAPDAPPPDPPRGGGPVHDPTQISGPVTTSPDDGSPFFPPSPAVSQRRGTPGVAAAAILGALGAVAWVLRRA